MKIKTYLKAQLFFLSIFFSTISYSQGCYFSTISDFGGQPTIYSGNPHLDQFLSYEYFKLVQCFGVRPNSFYIIEKSSENAYASSNITNTANPDGTVVLGLKLTAKECNNSASGTCVGMAVVMAHEFAHIVDFKFHFVNGQQPKIKELFADFMAGCYLHTRALTYAYTDVREAAQHVYAFGDNDFNSPLHHGTPQERMNSLTAGYNFSQQKVAEGVYSFTLQEAMWAAKNYLGF